MQQDSALEQLVSMSHWIGDPVRDFTILGEGNTSARDGEHSFWVKASGTELRTIQPEGFVRISLERVMSLLEHPTLSDEQIKAKVAEAKVDAATGLRPVGDDGVRPSVETVLHGICLSLPGVNYVAHTHPTAINSLTCSAGFEQAVSGRLFPDEIVVCGPAPVVVPYTDPGLPLAKRVRELIAEHMRSYGETPRTILMQNHGLIALGRSAVQVQNITAMAVKTARVLLGTFAAGGPCFMSAQAVARIHSRPDELYRRVVLGE